jgi:hypothetical protein
MFRLGFVLFPFALAGVLAHPYISLLAPTTAARERKTRR